MFSNLSNLPNICQIFYFECNKINDQNSLIVIILEEQNVQIANQEKKIKICVIDAGVAGVRTDIWRKMY